MPKVRYVQYSIIGLRHTILLTSNVRWKFSQSWSGMMIATTIFRLRKDCSWAMMVDWSFQNVEVVLLSLNWRESIKYPWIYESLPGACTWWRSSFPLLNKWVQLVNLQNNAQLDLYWLQASLRLKGCKKRWWTWSACPQMTRQPN